MFKLDTQFRIGGRRVSERDFMSGLERQAQQMVREEVESRARGVRCPVHGRTAQIRLQSSVGDQTRWTVEGCCQDLIDRVHSTLSED